MGIKTTWKRMISSKVWVSASSKAVLAKSGINGTDLFIIPHSTRLLNVLYQFYSVKNNRKENSSYGKNGEKYE
jgi:hypothetical protein